MIDDLTRDLTEGLQEDLQHEPIDRFRGVGSLLLGAVLGWIVVGLVAGLIWAISRVIRAL